MKQVAFMVTLLVITALVFGAAGCGSDLQAASSPRPASAVWSIPAVSGSIPTVSAGYEFTVGLKSDGTVVAAGDNRFGQRDVSGWSGIQQLSAGRKHTVGLK